MDRRTSHAASAGLVPGALALIVLAASSSPAPAAEVGPLEIPGFSSLGAETHRTWESVFLDTPHPDSIHKHLRILTEEPHVAGTPEGRRVALYIRDRMRSYGLESELEEYWVLLSYPERVSIALVEPVEEELSLREEPIAGDKDAADQDVWGGFHGYAADGDVTAQVIYANYGRPEDYAAIEKLGVSVAGKIVIARYGKLFRGLKVRIAQERGAAGVILYSDPANDGYARGDVYPDGPWRHPSAIQRGSVQFLSTFPGDPTTPGRGSVKGARRLRREEAENLPAIPSAPLGYGEARKILERLAGPNAPDGFQGALPFAYHVGPGPAKVRLQVANDWGVRPIWNVVTTVRGTEEPDRWVLCGNHHDAWTYGAVDPNSGTAASLEMGRAFGEALAAGWKPRRTIKILSWDGEEYGLLGSVEYGERYAETLPGRVVAYFNMDSAVRGRDMQLQGVPSLRDHLVAVLRDVDDPVTERPVGELWAKRVKKDARDRWIERERLRRAAGQASRPLEAEMGPLGSGSDYTVFLDHLGIPSVDIRFTGADGIYHSAYDDLRWVERHGDPLFVYHAAAARVWGLAAMRLADAPVVPLRYSRYGSVLSDLLDDLEEKIETHNLKHADDPEKQLEANLLRARALAQRIQQAGERIERATAEALDAGRERVLGQSYAAVNDALIAVERDLVAADGIRGRPWFRHLVYAPGKDTGYAAIPFPEPAHAVIDADPEALGAGLRRLEAALGRAAERLETVVQGAGR